MNSLILKNDNGLVEDKVILDHIHNTLKLQIGDEVRCTILGQGLATGRVTLLNDKTCELALGPITSGATQWFDLIVGLSRPQTTKKVLEHATTFGARNFHFFKASLSEKSYLDSKIFENEAYAEFLISGLSQSGIYTELPQFKLDKYNPAEQYKFKKQKFILDLKAEQSFLDVEINFDQPITLAIGPERGWINEDIERFHQAGFTSVKISSSILRVEHAVYSAISQLELIRGNYA